MSRIFLSHSSVDEIEAVGLKHWLGDNDWGDEEVFLDVDPERGLAAGERWQEALRKAADRCEAVVFIVSPAWAKSKWCLAEFLLAKTLHKLIFSVVLKDVPIGELPIEMTSEWQLCHLIGTGPKKTIRFQHRQTNQEVQFLEDGLKRLKLGLQKAGLNADFFPWPPKDDPQRAPYRGLEALDTQDAAVFFGRDVEIQRGLSELRGMRDNRDKQLFVILGASGAGKSSFLRAGLLPRLQRDDRHFYPLPVIRPQQLPISGEYGLANALQKTYTALKLPPMTRGTILNQLNQQPSSLPAMLESLQSAIHSRLLTAADKLPTPMPSLVLSVDQAEELFNPDAGKEARDFLKLLAAVLKKENTSLIQSLIVAFTIRSDRYEPLQTEPELVGLQSLLFDDIKPMPTSRFRDIILEPAKRATTQGRKLEVKPDLVNRLIEDSSDGGDTLPLLSLTLARLYRDYGSDGNLQLDEYEDMGGLKDIVKKEAESVLAGDPAIRTQQFELLHSAFIPWLATINPENDQPMRRMAYLDDLPALSKPLIMALSDKRLLLTDQRDGKSVIEVAHEALLRQWDVLAGWLLTERGDLKDADTLERAAQAWEKNGKKPDWLIEGERLTNAELLIAKPGFNKLLVRCNEFLNVSRTRENERKEEDRQRQQAELVMTKKLLEEQTARAASESKRRKLALMAMIVALALGSVSLYYWQSTKQSFREATAIRLIVEGNAITSGTQSGGQVLGLLKVLAGHRLLSVQSTDSIGLVLGLLNNLVGQRQPSLVNTYAALQTEYNKFGQLKYVRETPSPIDTVAFSPDGSRIVSGNYDKTLRLWDANTGKPIGQPLTGHEDSVSSVAFSPDGKRIVSGSEDKTLRLWDANTGKAIGQPFSGHKDYVSSVTFSPDGTRIVSGSWDKTLRLWDANTGKPIGQPLTGHEGRVTSVAFSPDGQRIASGSYNNTLCLWDANTGQAIVSGNWNNLRKLQAKTSKFGQPLNNENESGVISVAFSPDGQRIVSGGIDRAIHLWDTATGERIGKPLYGHEDGVSSVAFSPDGNRIVSGSWDKTLRLWDANTGEPIGQPITGHEKGAISVAFSPDGRRIVSGSWDKTLRQWDEKTDQPLTWRDESLVQSVAFSPDGKRIVSGSWDNTLRLWDANSGKAISPPLAGHKNYVDSVAFSPDGKRIVSGSWDKTLRLWDANTGKPIGQPLTGHEDFVFSVAFSPDGKRIVSGSGDKTLRLWDANTGKPIGQPLTGHEGRVTSVAFSPDGQRIASGSEDNTLRLWDTYTGKAISPPLAGHKNYVNSVAFSPDGKRIVSGSEDNTLRLWDAYNGKAIGPSLTGHNSPVQSVTFSPDGRSIASGSIDNTLRLWDANTGKPIGLPLTLYGDSVFSAAFRPDGQYIVSASHNSRMRSWPTTLRLWPVFESWADELCKKLDRNLSRKEWRESVSPYIDYIEQCPGLPIPPDERTTMTQ